eukprot:2029128-Alexandrium_andersonii.AAC.1
MMCDASVENAQQALYGPASGSERGAHEAGSKVGEASGGLEDGGIDRAEPHDGRAAHAEGH